MGRLAQLLHLGVRGTLSVVLERDALLPGDEVVGTVTLRVERPIERARLVVCLHGEQRLRWTTQSGETRVSHSMVVNHLNTTTVLADGDSMFAEGELQYPIAFQLPGSLPPNLRFTRRRVRDLQDVNVSVEYKVEATLEVDAFTTANITSCSPFSVGQVIAVPEPKLVVVQRQQDVKMFGLVRTGTCNLRVELASDVYDAQSTIEASISVSLSTGRRLKYLILALCENATIDRQRERRLKQGTRTIGRRRFEAATLDHREARELTLRLPITPNDIYKFDALLPTLQIQLLTLQYSVVVECHFSMAPKVCVSLPITIVTTAPHPGKNIATPEAA